MYREEQNRITELFKIKYPIIQGGMIWHSGWRLASAVSNSGGLGLIGSASMYPDILRENIRKCKAVTDKPFGVNVALLYPNLEEIINIILEEGVKIVFTSAGNPKTYTETLQKEGIKVAHVVSSTKFAIKCEDAGVDAIVAEGFEAGGHNGRDETTTMVLIPNVKQHISKPLIAAGGIADGRGMAAAFMLGARGIQMGTIFAASKESVIHENYKNSILKAKDIDSRVTGRSTGHPIRVLRNDMARKYLEMEKEGAPFEELEKMTLGSLRRAVQEGDAKNGSLMAGQIAGMIKEERSCEDIIKSTVSDACRLMNGVSVNE